MRYLNKVYLPASTISKAALNVPPGATVSTPETGDIWHEGERLKFKSASSLQTIVPYEDIPTNCITEDLGVKFGNVTLDYRGTNTCKYMYMSNDVTLSFLIDDIGVRTRLLYLHVHRSGTKILNISWPNGSEETITSIPLRSTVSNMIDVIVFAHMGGGLHLVSAPGLLPSTATNSKLGLVRPDGTSITISNGVISAIGGGGGGTYHIDGGTPSSIYTASQVIDGGTP